MYSPVQGEMPIPSQKGIGISLPGGSRIKVSCRGERSLMLIEIYPKPDGMQHINLMFCEAEPDPEDGWVRSHIEAFPTPPKRIFEEERAGRTYTTLQYGQCVIGHSMFYIEKHKVVVDNVLGVCASDLEQAALDGSTRNTMISRLAMELDKHTRFSVDEHGNLAIVFKEMDTAEIRTRLGELMAEETRARHVETLGSEV